MSENQRVELGFIICDTLPIYPNIVANTFYILKESTSVFGKIYKSTKEGSALIPFANPEIEGQHLLYLGTLPPEDGKGYRFWFDGNNFKVNTSTEPTNVWVKVSSKTGSKTFKDLGSVNDDFIEVLYSEGGHQRISADGDFILGFSDWPSSEMSAKLFLECVNFGGKDVTWSGVTWVKSDGSFTTSLIDNGITWQSSGVDFVSLWTRDGGATIYAKVLR